MADGKRPWDLTSNSSLVGAVDWLRKKAGEEKTLLVVAIRVDDLAISCHPRLAPKDVLSVLEDRAPELHQVMANVRAEALRKQDERRAREARRNGRS